MALNTLNIHLLYVLYRISAHITIYIYAQNYTKMYFLHILPFFVLNIL